jgi:hypothetical protein
MASGMHIHDKRSLNLLLNTPEIIRRHILIEFTQIYLMLFMEM